MSDIDSFNDIHPYFDDNPLSGSTTYSSNSLLEEFTDELALITYPPDYNDNLTCDIESDLREIEFLLYQGKDSYLKDSIDQTDLANLDDLFVDLTPEMFTDEHAPDYSLPSRFDAYPDDFLEIESDADNFYDDPFDSKGEKIKEAELLINDDDLPSPDTEDKVFNPGILIHEKLVTIITCVAQEKKLAISYAFLVFEDFDPPFYEPLVFKDVPNSMKLLPFSSENEEKVFKPRIYAFEKVHSCFLLELSHPECSSCGTLYTRDCSCSKGTIEDKILVPKPPKNCASTNVVNIPLEQFVVKQDHGSFVDKIICGLSKASGSPHLHTFSPNQFHCFHCKDALRDGESCQRCTCTRCRSGLSKGLCLICGNNQNSPDDSSSISANSSHNPPHIDERCFECGDALDGIFCQRCACMSCGKVPCISKPNFVDESSNIFNPPPQPHIYSCEFCGSNAQYVHYCTPQVPLIYPEPVWGPHETFQCQQVISCEPCCKNCGGPHKNLQCQPLNYYEPNPIYDSNYFGFDQFGDLHPQQHLCCDNYEGLHETSQCQPMNQNFYNSNSSGFNQTQPPQFPVIHPPPQETNIKILHDQEKVINVVQTFLRKFNHYSFFETPKVLLLAWDSVFKIKDAFGNEQYKPEDVQELFHKLLNDVQNIHEELAEYINTPSWNRPTFYNNGDDDDDADYTIAITLVLSTEEPDNSLSMGDEHLDTILTTKSDEVIKSSVEDLVPIPSEFKGIPDTMCDVHLVNNPTPLEAKDHFEIVINSNDDYSSSDEDSLYENIEYVEASPHDFELVSLEVEKIVIPEDEEIEDDNLRKKLLKVSLLIAEIEALKDNLTPSSEFLTKSSSTSSKSFLEETNTFDNSLPEFENFCFDLEEISSGSTTTHFDISLLEYEAFSFYDDHIEEIRSGSTTTTSDNSLPEYDSFIFDLLNDQFPPTDRSDFTHEEFGDEPAHIISEYDCFYFRNLPDPGELISILNFGIRENLSSTTCVNLPVEDDYSPLLAYVVWIFIAHLTYPVIPPHFHSFRNEDTIFDPGITINRFYSFKPGLSRRCRTFKKFNTHRSHLNESPMEMLFSTFYSS
nr:hypothetical protein [Tanacetum cinerariifolium]